MSYLLFIAVVAIVLLFQSNYVKASIQMESLQASYQQLVSYYRSVSGYFGDITSFWTTANSIETLANFYVVAKAVESGSTLVEEMSSIFENTYMKLKPFYFSYRRCHDDYLWWVLAWIRVYEVTGDSKYLEQSKIIFHRLVDTFNMWNSTCGGVTWSSASQYRNSITNELFLDAASRLSEISTNETEKLHYKSWAGKELNWFLSTKLINDVSFVVIDGLPGGSCNNDVEPVGDYWTYNSGVFLDGLVLNGQVNLAVNVSTAAITYFSPDDRIMREKSCSADTGYCDRLDGKMFKGAFVRHLIYALQRVDRDRISIHSSWSAEMKQWILLQADSIMSNASLPTVLSGGTNGLLLSQLWQGPPPAEDEQTPWVSQSAGLDALVAAYTITHSIPLV